MINALVIPMSVNVSPVVSGMLQLLVNKSSHFPHILYRSHSCFQGNLLSDCCLYSHLLLADIQLRSVVALRCTVSLSSLFFFLIYHIFLCIF